MSSWCSVGYDKVKEEAAKTNYAEEFRIADGETAVFRFLSEDPFSFKQHGMPKDGNRYPKHTCRAGMPGGCPLCEAGHKARFVGAFTVYDYRDKKIKAYIQGIRVLKILDRLNAREGGLTAQDFEISRSGKGTDTTYNFIPLKPTRFPEVVCDGDGKLKSIDFMATFAPESVDELKAAANKLQAPSPMNDTQIGGETTRGGVRF